MPYGKEPSVDDSPSMHTWKAAHENRQQLKEVTNSVNQSEVVEPGCLMNIDQATFCDVVSAEVEIEVADRLNGSSTTAGKDTIMNVFRLVTDYVPAHKKLTLNGPNDVSVSQISERGRIDSYFVTLLRSIAD